MKYFFITMLFFVNSLYSQIPNNSWRDHLPYTQATFVTEAGNKIFCSTLGGLVSYNKSDNSIDTYSKVNGLSDVSISSIGYSESTNTLVIAYTNGNIDLMKNKEIINVPDLKRKHITGNKSINMIKCHENYAYLATGIGIIVVNLTNNIIQDSYFFGDEGSYIKVNDITFNGNNIYAVTESGIYTASLSNPNLVDYQYWERLNFIPNYTGEYKIIESFNNKFYAAYETITGNDTIIQFNNNTYSYWNNFNGSNVFDFYSNNNVLIITGSGNVALFNKDELQIFNWSALTPMQSIIDKDEYVWVADHYEGLVQKLPDGSKKLYGPFNKPSFLNAGTITAYNDNIWIGGSTPKQATNYGIYHFSGNNWNNINYITQNKLNNVYGLYRTAIDPRDEKHVYCGSFGYGLVEIYNNQVVKVYDETNSIIRNIEGYTHGFIRINGLDYDNKNNLWFFTTLVNNPIYVIRANNELENIILKYNGFGPLTRITDIFVTSSDQIWVLLERKGIFVFKENEDGTFSERFFTMLGKAGDEIKLLENPISIAEDIDGDIWVGTSNGPIKYPKPNDNIFNSNETVYGYQVLIPRNDESDLADILLTDESITAVEVDGGNRKWFSTANSGVFLTSSDGKKEIHNFNIDNSPLFSNNVLDVGVNGKTGEVFFATNEGVLSFMGQAIDGNTDFNDVYVYPNPVRETYDGDITISGLINNSNVKITDISGNMVYETTSLGGQAIWHGKNYNGKRVNTGVYLIFLSNEDGSKTFITKLLFIH